MREARTIKNYISKEGFRKWVEAMYNQFMESRAAVRTNKNYTYVYLRSKVGTAKCNSTDEWSNRIGIAYAWARCTGQPEYYEKEEKKYIPNTGEWVGVKTVDGKVRNLMYIYEGVDNYCFKIPCGHLILIDKDRVTNFIHAK